MCRTKVFQNTRKGDRSQSVKIYTTVSYLQLYLAIMYTQVVSVIELREVQLQLAPGPPLSQVTEGDLDFGENKKAEGGVLVNNEDSSNNGNVNVSKLIDFYNSLSVVHSYALK